MMVIFPHDDFPDALPLGCQIQEYKVNGILGRGGFGITYRAEDENLSRTVAIKEFFPVAFAYRASRSVLSRPGEPSKIFTWGLSRFIDEARTLARFRHHNIVKVVRYFSENGTAYIVMEFERGENIGQHISSMGSTLSEKYLLGILFQILDALETVHRQGILHRDLKPDNILIRSDGNPVLIDFGASRQAIGTHSQLLTSIMTPGYAPLEQYSSTDRQGAWTDIYSLGAVLFEIVSGRKPPDSILRTQKDNIVSAQIVGCDRYTPEFLSAIDWALKMNPEERPQSVAAWRAAIQHSRVCANLDSNRLTTQSGPSFQSPIYQDGANITRQISAFPSKEQYYGTKNKSNPSVKNRYYKDIIHVVMDNKLPTLFTVLMLLCIVSSYYFLFSHKELNIDENSMSGDTLKQDKLAPEADYSLAKAEAAANRGDYKEAIHLYELAFGKGNIEAAYRLSAIYLNSIDFPIDINKSYGWARLAAEKGHIGAQRVLGYFYSGFSKEIKDKALKYNFSLEGGFPVKVNEKEAQRLFESAASQGDVPSRSYLASGHYYGGGRALGDAMRDEWADQGVPVEFILFAGEPKDNVQRQLIAGRDASRQGNLQEAIDFYKAAASEGSLVAQYLIWHTWLRLEQNNKLQHDHDQIRKEDMEVWLTKAAEGGYAHAQAMLASNLWSREERYPEDIEKILHYGILAGEHGDHFGQSIAGQILTKFDYDLFYYHDYKPVTLDYLKKIQIVDEEYDDSNLFDVEKGMRFLMQAAEQADFEAINILEYMYKNGKVVEKDEKRANAWRRTWDLKLPFTPQ